MADGRTGLRSLSMDSYADARAGDLASEGEARFRLLVEHSSDGLYLIGPDGNVHYASPPVERLLGFERRELTGRHFLDYLHPDDRDHAGWFFADVLSKPGVALRARYRCLHRDGEFRHLEAVGVNRLADAEVGAVVVNFRDVTERRRAEQALVESEDRFRAVFESALVGIARLDPAGRIADTNRAIVEMFGYQLEELRGRVVTDFIHEEEREQAVRDWRELADGGVEHCRAERRIVRRDGNPVWVTLTASMVRDAQGHPRFAIAMLENITERKQTEAALQETNRRLAGWVSELEERRREIALLSEMGDLLRACRSVEEAYGVVEPMARQLFPEESGSISVIGAGSGLVETVAQWGAVHSSTIFSVDDCWALRRGRPHTVDHGERGLVCKHAGELGASASICVPLLAQGELLGVLHLKVGAHGRSFDTRFRFVMTVAEHVSLAIANLKLRETLRSQSIRDPLTGLFNRRYMEESLEREMRRAARGHHPVGIIMLDLDDFKGFNDSHGHDAGDTLLRMTATTLQRSVRAEDIACRYGGEEFALILPEASLLDSVSRAEAICESVRALAIEHRRQQVTGITISAGVAVYPEHGPTGHAVLRAADAALYQAKIGGRDCVYVNRGGFFVPSLGLEREEA